MKTRKVEKKGKRGRRKKQMIVKGKMRLRRTGVETEKKRET